MYKRTLHKIQMSGFALKLLSNHMMIGCPHIESLPRPLSAVTSLTESFLPLRSVSGYLWPLDGDVIGPSLPQLTRWDMQEKADPPLNECCQRTYRRGPKGAYMQSEAFTQPASCLHLVHSPHPRPPLSFGSHSMVP